MLIRSTSRGCSARNSRTSRERVGRAGRPEAADGVAEVDVRARRDRPSALRRPWRSGCSAPHATSGSRSTCRSAGRGCRPRAAPRIPLSCCVNRQPGWSAADIELWVAANATWSSVRSHSCSLPLQAVLGGVARRRTGRRRPTTAIAGDQRERGSQDQDAKRRARHAAILPTAAVRPRRRVVSWPCDSRRSWAPSSSSPSSASAGSAPGAEPRPRDDRDLYHPQIRPADFVTRHRQPLVPVEARLRASLCRRRRERQDASDRRRLRYPPDEEDPRRALPRRARHRLHRGQARGAHVRLVRAGPGRKRLVLRRGLPRLPERALGPQRRVVEGAAPTAPSPAS